MKKSISLLLVIVFLGAVISFLFVDKKHYKIIEPDYTSVDMSSYKEMNSVDHRFMRISPKELLRVIEEGESAVFYLGYASCPNCQEAVKLIDKAAEESDIFVYYINAYDAQYPLSDYLEQVEEKLAPILPVRSGKKSIQVPLVFAVKEGVISENYCGLIKSYDGSEKADQAMIKIYKNIMKDFEE